MDGNDGHTTRNDARIQFWRFLGVFFVIFFLAATFLYIIDFVPEKPSDESMNVESVESFAEIVDVNAIAAAPVSVESAVVAAPIQPLASAPSTAYASTGNVPVRIVVPSVGVDTSVIEPKGSDIASLDTALLSGAVRYPASATFSEAGDIMILGHQSYLPVVRNKAFKAFNDLQDLEAGEEIIVYSATEKYTYRVFSVVLAQASDGKVALRKGVSGLVLVTCNSLGAKEDRYVVTADLVSRESI